MHTMRVVHEGGDVWVFHNSDWSGLATVRWVEGGKDREVELPGSLLRAIGAEAAVSALKAHVLGAIEGWTGA